MKTIFDDDHMGHVLDNLSAGSNDEAEADTFCSDSDDENAESDCEDPFASMKHLTVRKDPCESKNEESGLYYIPPSSLVKRNSLNN